MYVKPVSKWTFSMPGVYVPDDTPQAEFIDKVKAGMIELLQSTPSGQWPTHWYGMDGDRAFEAYIDNLQRRS